MIAAPALKRGFEILDLLNQHQALSLEAIAASTRYPKASLLRLLETMTELGLVTRITENKHYRALFSLTPHQQEFSNQLSQVLQRLAVKCAACIEWYEIDKKGMRIAQRFTAPENQVQVRARVGFLRQWFDELEAVSAVTLAFADVIKQKKPGIKMWSYDEQGESRFKSAKKLGVLIKQTCNEGYYCDEYYNDNGVKRMAAPVMKNNKFRGIVAIAMSYRPQLDKHLEHNKHELLHSVNQLSR